MEHSSLPDPTFMSNLMLDYNNQLRQAPMVEVATADSDSTRVSEKQRDQLSHLLTQAFGQGFLSYEEHDQRSTQALQVVTRGQARTLLADLPGEFQLRFSPTKERIETTSFAWTEYLVVALLWVVLIILAFLIA